nr:GNAT family N-acetyltransferase [Saccharopolyspora erythraea]
MSTTTGAAASAGTGVSVRPLQEGDLDTADLIMRTAFGTFLGVPEPVTVFGDAEYVRSRFTAEPDWAFAAERDGEIVGSNFVTRWGSFGYFGPLTVRPDLWGQGIASLLMRPVMDLFDRWRVRQAGLFTFPQSPRHIGLYQKFGFWPQYLTPLMDKAVSPVTEARGYTTYSETPEAERDGVVRGCFAVTNAIFDGLDVAHEIRATHAQDLGDTVLLHDGTNLCGLAVCHCGAGEPVAERASSSSERCGQGRRHRNSSVGCSTPAKIWRVNAASNEWSPV